MKQALIIVDVQNDFVEGGALAVAGGKGIIPLINVLAAQAQANGWLVVTTQDWHRAGTPHFDKWPEHCLEYSRGAAFADGLYVPPSFAQFKKGQGDGDGYSGFAGLNEELVSLDRYLKDNGVDHVYVCGIATDYCVQATAMQAIAHGYQVTWIENASVGVAADTTDEAIRNMRQAGVQFMTAYLTEETK